jgi:hypothetical protein
MSAAELRHHLSQLGWSQARIEQRLAAIETGLAPRTHPHPNGHANGSGLSLVQWLKVAVGIALPLIVLLATGNVELARRLLVP